METFQCNSNYKGPIRKKAIRENQYKCHESKHIPSNITKPKPRRAVIKMKDLEQEIATHNNYTSHFYKRNHSQISSSVQLIHSSHLESSLNSKNPDKYSKYIHTKAKNSDSISHSTSTNSIGKNGKNVKNVKYISKIDTPPGEEELDI